MHIRTLIGWGAALGVAAGFAACSLHLDKSKIAGKDAGSDVASGGSSGGGSGGSSASGGTGGTLEAGSECDANAQCKSDAACVEGNCNNGNCIYQLCPVTQACMASSCDPQNQTCTQPQQYNFFAGAITVGKDLACGKIAARCVAAMGDYVFVGTTNGVKAWHVTNPKAPVPVTVSPQPLFATTINRLVSNGKRVLILDSPGGGTLNVAWIDLPTDPNPKQIPTTSVGLNFSDTFNTSYPADGDNFFLVKSDQVNFYPSARLDLPLQDNDTVSLSPCTGLPSGGYIVGSSGSRLIQFRVDSSTGPFKPLFGFENSAGTSTAQYASGSEQDLSSNTGNVPTAISAHRFESTYNGGLLWATNEIVDVDAGIQEADAVVLRWPLLNATDTSFNGQRSVVIEQYSLFSYNTLYAGPMAEIDPTTALVTAALPGNTSQTSVRAVKRDKDALSVTPAPPSPGRQIPVDPGSIGVAAGRKFGYVLVPNQAPSGTPPDTTIDIFDPNCK